MFIKYTINILLLYTIVNIYNCSIMNKSPNLEYINKYIKVSIIIIHCRKYNIYADYNITNTLLSLIHFSL